ncbi:hypothetical protein [Thiofilum flexile]|uniref:hypothetical protein n=1 Tax=Thiofilum flexile TaxID=125627 RepID=UPI000366B351|nr:hypothetical protein [Thiofilum flexile]
MNPIPINHSTSSVGSPATTPLHTKNPMSANPHSMGKHNTEVDLSKLLSLLTQLLPVLIARMNHAHNSAYETPGVNYLSQPNKTQSALLPPSLAIIRPPELPSDEQDHDRDINENPFLYKWICRVLLDNDTLEEKNQELKNQELNDREPPQLRYKEKNQTTLRVTHTDHNAHGQDSISFNPIRRTFVSAADKHQINIIEEVDFWQAVDTKKQFA